MLVRRGARPAGKVQDVAGVQHGIGQGGRLRGRHAAEVDGHGHGRHLVVRQFACGIGLHKGPDLLRRKDTAITFVFDQPLR